MHLRAQIEVTPVRAGPRTGELLRTPGNEIWPLLRDGAPLPWPSENRFSARTRQPACDAVVIDTGAVVAKLLRENQQTEQVAVALASEPSPVMAAPSVVECLIVLTSRHGPVARTVFDRLCSAINLGVVDSSRITPP